MNKLLLAILLAVIPVCGQQLTLSFNGPMISFVTASPLAPCTVGVLCTQTIKATGGQAPLYFSIVSQGTSAGITSAGVLTLTAPTAGNFKIKVMVYDGGAIQQSIVQVYSLTVKPAVATKNLGVSWTNSITSGVIGYNIFKGSVPGGIKTQQNTAPVNSQPYIDTNTPTGVQACYTLTAIGSDGVTQSPSSIETCATP